MNKHDFYKQLMSEYSFDADKIRNNAKNGRYAKQKISPFALGLTAAVAACTVACGTLAMNMLNNRNGVDLVGGDQSLSALSYSERVQNAIEKQNQARDSEEIVDVMVTFSSALAPRQAEAVIAAHTDGSIPVKTVYLADGSKIAGNDQIAAVFNSDVAVSALCIECPGSVMALLQSDPDVCLVEVLTEADLDTIVPIAPEDIETIESSINDIIPSDNEAPVVVAPVPDDTADALPVAPETAEPDAITTEPAETVEVSETIEASESTDAPETAETLPDITTETDDVPEATESAEAVLPDEPAQSENIVIPDKLPDNVVLPVSPEAYVYETAYLNAETAYFISSNIMFVCGDGDFALYSYYGEKEQLVQQMECESPKVHWVAENGGRILVSGLGENNTRNKLWLVDAYSMSIIDLHADDTVMDGTLTDIGYNQDSRTLVFVIKEYGTYYTYAMNLNTDNTTTNPVNVFSTETATTLLACSGSKLYLAVADGALAQIYAVDTNNAQQQIIKTYSGSPKFSKNLAFTHGIIAPSDSAVTGSVLIFDPVTESFIDTGSFDNSVAFGASKHTFALNGSYYTVSGGALSSTGGIANIAPVDYTKSLSNSYSAYAEHGYVKITDSAYTNDNRSAVLDFGHITSSGDAEFRSALSGAIGINNALALELCRESGMYKPELLTDSIRVYYTENAAAQLKKLCNIQEFGTLGYTNGSLKAITESETELVITSSSETSATGTLYIKAGTFGGKTAYRSVSVSFAFENGAWKLDTIIGK